MAVRTAAQALIEALEAEGVETIFGIPGTHSLYLYDALVDSRIRHVLVRHEQAAAYMADGYARSTGKVGVCLTTTGPATINALAALATSYSDSIPVLLLCTQIRSEYIGQDKGFFHEVPDQLGMLRGVTGFCARPTDGQDAVAQLQEAMRQARSGRPRPVALELPADVLSEKDDFHLPPPKELTRPVPEPGDIDRVVEALAGAQRPVIWAGGGVTASGAEQSLMHLAEALPAPIVTTNLGKAAVPGDHPLCLGYTVGQKPVRQYLEQCDLMLAVGTRFSYLATDCWTMKFPETVIHIDIDAGVIGRNYDVTQGLVGDAGGILEAILDRLGERSPPPGDRRGEVAALKAAVHSIWTSEIPREHQLIQDIRAALPRSTIVAGDPSMCAYLAWQMLDLYAPRSYLYPMGGATLGYGFPSALGAKAAHPDRPVVAICGDAGFLFSCQELATAVQYDLNIVTLIFNDSGYGALRVQQDDVFGRRSEVDLRSPDFVALAESFGAAAQRVEDLDQLQPVLSAALGHSCPTVIEVPVALSVQNLTT